MVKYGGTSWGKLDPKEKIYMQIRPDSTVLDIGCSVGLLGRKLKREKRCYVEGVDVSKEAVAEAKKYLHRVGLIDLTDIGNLKKFLNNKKYDYIICIDVLEHTANPETILKIFTTYIKKDGLLIVSLPNTVRYDIRFKFLLGKFEYSSFGILDEDHLRFFTLKTARKLLLKTGWKIVKEEFTYPENRRLALLTPFFKTLLATQFIFYARQKQMLS